MRICDDTAEYEADMYQTASDLIWVHYHSYNGEEVDFQIDYYTRMKDNQTIECGGELNGRVFLMDQFWALVLIIHNATYTNMMIHSHIKRTSQGKLSN